MVRRTKSLEEIIIDLNQLKVSYQHQNLDMNEIKRQYDEYRNAKQYIKRNKDLNINHPIILQKNQIITQNKESYLKYNRILNIERKINKMRQTNQQANQPVNQCANCKRCNKEGVHPRYLLTLISISSSNIKNKATFKYITASNENRRCDYLLCNECKEYLVEDNKEPRYIWTSFLWHILSMGNETKFDGEYKYFSIYSGEH